VIAVIAKTGKLSFIHPRIHHHSLPGIFIAKAEKPQNRGGRG
jgi:hypothetical protein